MSTSEKAKQFYYSVIIRLNFARLCLRKINKPFLGLEVVYNGERCRIINGACSPYFRIMPITKENMKRQRRFVYDRVHPKDFKMDNSFSRRKQAFQTHYKFLMDYWYKIYIGRKLYPELYSA